MSERDLFDALREADPAAGIDLADQARIKDRVYTRVLTATRPQSAWPRLKKPGAVVLVAILALATVAAAWYLTRQPTNPTGIGCYQGLNLDSPQHVVTPAETVDPAECAPLWADGTITNPAVVPPGQIPPLLGCVNDSGTLTVFPTDDAGFCKRLGMANYVSPPDAGSIVDVQQHLVDMFLAQGCIEMDDARQLVEQALADAGLDGWTVAISQPPTAEQPCASLAFEGDTHQILLVPVPRTDH